VLTSVLAGDAPGLLGFATDDFMTELETSLAADPPTTADHVAEKEHWSTSQPPMFAVPARPPTQKQDDLKLYQPAHGRFYLVAAHLCCRRFGFPDRSLSEVESVGFVLRRVELAGSSKLVEPDDPSTFTELAWVPAGGGGTWKPVASRFVVHDGEEVLPLVPTVHTHDGRRSRLLAGLVPVGARERYEARGKAAVGQMTTRPGADPLANPRRALLEGTVIEAFRQVELMRGKPEASTNDLAETVRWALLDLVDFITKVAGQTVTGVADARFGAAAISAPTTTSWATIVKQVAAERTALLEEGKSPSAQLSGWLGAVRHVPPTPTMQLDLTALISALVAYGLTFSPPTTPTGAGPVKEPDPVRGLLYVTRCVYQRTDCKIARPEWVSAPSVPFRFASFFDPDAPQRPVQISLPVDTSQAGLRAFPKSVSILVSKQLRAQMDQVKGIDKFGAKETFDLGMLCTLSIPIITIAALILLMVIVAILNIVFFWMPLFKICLPKPGGNG
jgi:hypothetical protein